MDQEYKADVCCPRNTSAAEVDNSVEKLTGDSTVRNGITTVSVNTLYMQY
jgi:hypothetical protein